MPFLRKGQKRQKGAERGRNKKKLPFGPLLSFNRIKEKRETRFLARSGQIWL